MGGSRDAINKGGNITLPSWLPYSPNYVTRTSANGSAVYWSCDFSLYHVTTILHCHWLKFCYVTWTIQTICYYLISIKNAKYKLKNYIRSKPEILRILWDIVVIRLVEYLLNMSCLTLQLSYKIAYLWIFV